MTFNCSVVKIALILTKMTSCMRRQSLIVSLFIGPIQWSQGHGFELSLYFYWLDDSIKLIEFVCGSGQTLCAIVWFLKVLFYNCTVYTFLYTSVQHSTRTCSFWILSCFPYAGINKAKKALCDLLSVFASICHQLR